MNPQPRPRPPYVGGPVDDDCQGIGVRPFREDAETIRPLAPADRLAVHQVDRFTTGRPMPYPRLARFLAEGGRGLVVERWGKVVGFVLTVNARTRTNVMHLGVAPGFRHKGIGSRLLLTVRDCSPGVLRWHVRETDTYLQCWLRRRGWEADKVLREFFDDTHEDAYRFTLEGPLS